MYFQELIAFDSEFDVLKTMLAFSERICNVTESLSIFSPNHMTADHVVICRNGLFLVERLY